MRYYDPALARWTTPDPAGFLDGINLYAYVHNNPMLYIDRYGLFGESFFAGLQDFEWKSSFRDSSFYQSFESTAQNIWSSPRFQGSMQAIGGFAEAGFGAGMTFATGGVTAPVGCAVMAHGLDHFFTGINSIITGRPAESVTSQLFQKAGMSPQNAHLLDTGLSLAGSIGGMKLAQQGAGAFRASTVNTSGKLIPAESISIGNEGLGAVSKKVGRKRFVPDSNAEGPHSVFRRDPITGKVSHYETFRHQTNSRNPNAWESVKRFDGPQHSHYHFNKVIKERVYAPHIHDPHSLGGIRSPENWEIPKY